MILLVFLALLNLLAAQTRNREIFGSFSAFFSVGNNSPPPGEGWVVVGGGVAGGVAGDR